jgi:mannobiose 2-epimerase
MPSCSRREESGQKLHQVREEIMSDLLTNVLPFWEVYSPDPSGGFYGVLKNDGAPVAGAGKALALNARILWTFSAAYRAFEVENYKRLANRAQRYLTDHFADPEYGGVYWSVTAAGEPADTGKQTYGLALAIYGLSEHYRATRNPESLEQAIAFYTILQDHAYDAVNGGYIDSFTRHWQLPEHFGYNGKGTASKTTDTHIRLLEAFTNLYRVWPDSRLKKQLSDLADIFFDEIINPETCRAHLFFTMEWSSLEDSESCGHDMEISWLLCQAAAVIDDRALAERTKEMAVGMVDARMREGWNPGGYLLSGKTNGKMGRKIEWWPQAEAVTAFINAWQLTGRPAYAAAAATTWNWIRENVVDQEYGEWYYSLDKNHMPLTARPKANMWKSPCPNTRMALETIARIRWSE